jgi:Ca2+-binding EF-hand superfamily protein
MLALAGWLLCCGPIAAQGNGPPDKKAKEWNPVKGVPELVHGAFVGASAKAGQVEFVQMLGAVLDGSSMGPGDGWFHPSRTKYGWTWVSYHFDKNHDGKVTREEFGGPAHVFNHLDRNGDGVLTAKDFEWKYPAPPKPLNPNPAKIFSMLDVDGDGKISLEEWVMAFEYLAAGKDHLQLADLAQMYAPLPENTMPKGGPSTATLVKGLFAGELGSMFEGPEVGDLGPDFTLKTQDGKQKIRLSQFRGQKPVVLIFGSFT